MSRVARLRIICTIMAVLCLGAGSARLVEATFPLFNPLWSTSHVLCHGLRCEVLTDPLRLLGPAKSIVASRTPDAAEKLAARSRAPQVRWTLFASTMLRAVPDFLMYLALALALRHFARGDPFGLQAVRWLRRAALTAGASVLAQPLASTLRSTALEPALTGERGIVFAVAGSEVAAGLFLAGVVWVAAWALEEGRRTHDELAQYV